LRFDRATLDNGLEMIGEYNENARSMATGFFVRTGARDETPEIMGASHFLEHMMFKGTDRRTPEDVNREFDEMGAQYNAFTSEENTVYYGAVLPEFQPRVIDLLSDMMRPSLRDEDFHMEKNVILEEIALYKDRPQFRLFDRARQVFFGDHPLGHQVLGTEQTIRDLTRDQMNEYFALRYAPNNLCFTLAGNYDWEAAKASVERQCGSWATAETRRAFPERSFETGREFIKDEKLQMVHIALVAPGFSAQDERRHAGNLVAESIGGSKGSRLYWALVDPGLADTAHVYLDTEDQSGEFIVYLSALPQKAQEVLDIARRILTEVQDCGANSKFALTQEELSRAQRKLASGMVVGGETPFGRLVPVGFDWVYRGEVRTLNEHVDDLLNVTLEQTHAVLEQRPFDAWTMVALGPIDDLCGLAESDP